MAQAVIPRDPSLARILMRFSSRIRRLEINKNLPLAGTAIYAASYSGATASWVPSFTGATASIGDQIGLTLADGGIQIPQGWLAWVAVAIDVTITDPATGDALLWDVIVGNGVGDTHQDPIFPGANTFSGLVCAPSGWDSTDPLAVNVGTVTTAYGETFTPAAITMAVAAIQLPQGGWPSGGIG